MPKHFFLRNRKWVLSALVFTFALIIFFSPFLSGAIKNISLGILGFPGKVLSRMEDCFAGKGELMRENAILKQKTGELSLRIQQFTETVRENERLRSLLDLREDAGVRSVAAEIIARDPSDWTGSFVLDKGAGAGITTHSSVCSSAGLLGKVTDVREDTSTVMLLTNPGFKAGAMLKEAQISGIIAGEGEGRARLRYIPLDADVRKGELVVTSGLSRNSPKGLVIGRVVSVGKSPTGLYKYAEIEPSADPLSQEVVLCIK